MIPLIFFSLTLLILTEMVAFSRCMEGKPVGLNALKGIAGKIYLSLIDSIFRLEFKSLLIMGRSYLEKFQIC